MQIKQNHFQEIYFLIHGAWHGSWCWQDFIPQLTTTHPCKVIALNLPGRGTDTTPLANIGIKQHVDYIKKAIQQQTEPVTLVAHSLAGLSCSQVAENHPELIKKIIYIAAYVPENNHSMRDEVKLSQPGQMNDDLIFDGATIALKKTANVKRVLYTQSDEATASACLEKLVPESARLFFETITLTPNRFGVVPKKYICTSQDQALTLPDQLRMAERLPHCEIITIPTDHSPFLSHPELLANVLD